MKDKTLASDDPLWVEVFELSAVAARKCHRHWGRWASFDDLRGAALEYAVRRNDVVIRFLRDPEDDESRKQGSWQLTRALERAAERFARKEKAAACGYDVDDEFYYSEPLIEKLLASHWAGGPIEAGQVVDPEEIGGRRGKKPANEGGDLLAMNADVEAALRALDGRSLYVLRSRIAEGATLQRLGADLNLSHQRISQLEKAAMRKLIEILGGWRP